MSHSQGAASDRPLSVCLFCGSSSGVNPAYIQAAREFGETLAKSGGRLVYGGGGIGLMGASAKAAHAAAGRVLGVMPSFLRRHEVIYDDVETVIVETMHERKRIMFEQSDAFAIFPGGIGTLEEVVELMSWRRLDLHRKPIVFLNLEGFWRPFFDLMAHMVAEKLTPTWMPDTWGSVDSVEDVLPTIETMLSKAATGPGFFGYAGENAEIASKS